MNIFTVCAWSVSCWSGRRSWFRSECGTINHEDDDGLGGELIVMRSVSRPVVSMCLMEYTSRTHAINEDGKAIGFVRSLCRAGNSSNGRSTSRTVAMRRRS